MYMNQHKSKKPYAKDISSGCGAGVNDTKDISNSLDLSARLSDIYDTTMIAASSDIRLIGAREAAQILGVNANVVYDLWNRGLLDFWLIHNTKKTNLAAIAEFLQKTRNIDLEGTV